MTQYLLSVYHPEITEDAPPPESMPQIMADVDALNQELRAAGAWVFAGGLHPSSTATVVRLQDGEVLTTDGPFVESKECIGGFSIVQADTIDAAAELAKGCPHLLTGGKVEVRVLAGLTATP